jgi:hypothetical protein
MDALAAAGNLIVDKSKLTGLSFFHDRLPFNKAQKKCNFRLRDTDICHQYGAKYIEPNHELQRQTHYLNRY